MIEIKRSGEIVGRIYRGELYECYDEYLLALWNKVVPVTTRSEIREDGFHVYNFEEVVLGNADLPTIFSYLRADGYQIDTVEGPPQSLPPGAEPGQVPPEQ